MESDSQAVINMLNGLPGVQPRSEDSDVKILGRCFQSCIFCPFFHRSSNAVAHTLGGKCIVRTRDSLWTKSLPLWRGFKKRCAGFFLTPTTTTCQFMEIAGLGKLLKYIVIMLFKKQSPQCRKPWVRFAH
ncbi:hypothetical protein RHMOL_Rhmol06G0075100 [Rhododendron molle]|uniref:Uncharacterized protein n=1 Tax=Rhododendron molle TaxID=49168 RepID=A0ACC0NBQ5_RHOML|nr:hypothetical protein RHMOL_Rhmol06G0075100 [Rhododendron molle]